MGSEDEQEARNSSSSDSDDYFNKQRNEIR